MLNFPFLLPESKTPARRRLPSPRLVPSNSPGTSLRPRFVSARPRSVLLSTHPRPNDSHLPPTLNENHFPDENHFGTHFETDPICRTALQDLAGARFASFGKCRLAEKSLGDGQGVAAEPRLEESRQNKLPGLEKRIAKARWQCRISRVFVVSCFRAFVILFIGADTIR